MKMCEVIYVRDKQAAGWKWRPLEEEAQRVAPPCVKTYRLYYDCVKAARANGYTVNAILKCS